MAQHTPAQLGAKRLPIMDGALLDARTRPLHHEPTPIWLRHRLQRPQTQKSKPAPRRAREWIERLAGRSGS